MRDEAAFDGARRSGPAPSCPTPRRRCSHQVLRVLAEWRPVEKALHGRVEMAMLPAMTDLRAQLGRLVHPGFIAEAGRGGAARLPPLPQGDGRARRAASATWPATGS